MDYQTVDTSFADRLASKEFDPQEFVREVVSESIGDSDVLANKVKLQAFAERTARNLRDSVTRNYSKFLTTADEVALLEDEMYHLRSLSNHYKAVMNFLKDFVIREELRDTQIEKSTNLQWKTANELKGSDEDAIGITNKRDETHLLTSLSILIDQAESIGLISPWRSKLSKGRRGGIDRTRPPAFALTDEHKDSVSLGQANESMMIDSSFRTSGSTTDDGRRLLCQAYLTLLDSDTLLEKTHLQLFLLEGCILLCTSAGSLYQDMPSSSTNPFIEDLTKPSQSNTRSARLNLLTAIDVDGSLSVTDVKDTTELSTFGAASFRNTFKLTKSGREIFILKATSAQSKAACINSIVSYLDLVTESSGGRDSVLNSKWSSNLNNPSSSEGTDVILSLLSDQLAELELAICHRQQNQAEELILQCRQRFSNLAPEVRASSEGSRIGFTLNQLEQRLVQQIRNGPKALQERGRSGQGLRDPKREINLLKRLGYNSDAIELFIHYQRMSFSTQRRSETVYGIYSTTSGINGSKPDSRLSKITSKASSKCHSSAISHKPFATDIGGQYNESFSDTLKSQIEHELNNRICLFFDSIRRAEQNFHDNFSTERTECASTFLVWLGAEIEVSVDSILHEAYSAKESTDGCWVLGRIAEVVKMLSDGASSAMSINGTVDTIVDNSTTTEEGDHNVIEGPSQRLDIMFLIEEKLASVLNLAIREDKQKLLEVIRSWSRSESSRLTNEPLQLLVRPVKGNDPGDDWYISSLVSPPAFLVDFINAAPEIVGDLNQLMTLNADTKQDRRNVSKPRVPITTENAAQSLGVDGSSCIPATLDLTYCTVVFSKLLITFARQCFTVYMEKTKQSVVESIVEIMKLYLRLLGQTFNQATAAADIMKHESKTGPPDGHSTPTVATTSSNQISSADVEFIFTNIKFAVSVVFNLIDTWFQQLTGGSSKYFSKIYEKLQRFESEIEVHRKNISF